MKIVNIKSSVPGKVKASLNEAIADAVAMRQKEAGKADRSFSRKRTLSIETMFKLLLSMHGGSLKKELVDAGIDATSSAFVQRRKQIDWMDFENLFESFNNRSRDTETFKGFQVLAIDGTAVNLPTNPKASSYMSNGGKRKGYNQLHANILYNVLSKTYTHCTIQSQPETDEVEALWFMLRWYNFPSNTLIVADRGYESYNNFAYLLESGLHFLIRVRQDRSAMREIAKLPMMELDTKVSFTITTTQTNKDKANGYILVQTNRNRIQSSKSRGQRWDFPSPYPMSFRVVRVLLDTGQYETLVTNLPPEITAQELKELYHARWGIETAFRELKYGLGLVNLHGKSDDFAKQEIYCAMTMANFCSRIVNQVIIEQDDSRIYEYQVNHTMAVHLCKKYFREENGNGRELMRSIAKHIEPVRPGRQDQRNLRAKGFTGFIYRVSA